MYISVESVVAGKKGLPQETSDEAQHGDLIQLEHVKSAKSVLASFNEH